MMYRDREYAVLRCVTAARAVNQCHVLCRRAAGVPSISGAIQQRDGFGPVPTQCHAADHSRQKYHAPPRPLQCHHRSATAVPHHTNSRSTTHTQHARPPRCISRNSHRSQRNHLWCARVPVPPESHVTMPVSLRPCVSPVPICNSKTHNIPPYPHPHRLPLSSQACGCPTRRLSSRSWRRTSPSLSTASVLTMPPSCSSLSAPFSRPCAASGSGSTSTGTCAFVCRLLFFTS